MRVHKEDAGAHGKFIVQSKYLISLLFETVADEILEGVAFVFDKIGREIENRRGEIENVWWKNDGHFDREQLVIVINQFWNHEAGNASDVYVAKPHIRIALDEV